MQAWENFLAVQEQNLGAKTVDKWLRPLRIVRYDACNLYLEAKDSFQLLWFEEHIRKIIQSSFVNNNQKKIKVHLTLPSSQQKTFTQNKEKKSLKQPDTKPSFVLKLNEINTLCTFDNFITSEINILAYKLLSKLSHCDHGTINSDKTFDSFNPVYLFGNEGTGKTHLLMAAALALKASFPNVIYVRAETFTEHVVAAIRGGEMGAFRQTYRTSDVILIDDVHVFSNKGATQEELFHTFNALHLAGKQIILSANCSPAELKNIEPRLVSRFEWGIVLPLGPLSGESLKQALKAKAKALEFHLPEKVVDFLLSKFSKNSKSLLRALEALILRMHMQNERKKNPVQTLNVTTVMTLLSDLLKEEESKKISSEQIILKVSEHFGIRKEDLLEGGRTRDFVLPRHLAMYLCRKNLKLPFTKIGEIFSRDHSTVMSSIKLIQNGVENYDQEIAGHYHSILKTLN